MADYHTPTIVSPFIPQDDMTPLERLVLGLVFDEEITGEGLVYFHSWCGPSDVVSAHAGDLKEALDSSQGANSVISDHVAARLARLEAAGEYVPADYIELDLSGPNEGHERMFQDILRRSRTLEEIVVTEAFTCTQMCQDGFGGGLARITADKIRYRSTTDILAEFRAEASG